MAGVTVEGLEIRTLGEIRDEINAAWREAFGASMDVSDRSPDGQLIGIVSERFALIEEVLEVIVSARDPAKASGALLKALCALTGTRALPASYSTVTLTLTGTPTTPVPAGQLVSTESTGRQFTTLADVVIAAATAWAGATTYAVGDRRTNAGNIYLCITAGTSAGSGGPDEESEDETDGSVHWRFVGTGTGYVDVLARATELGPIVAVSGDLTAIDTPIGGWDGAVNILDATLGRDKMLDPALRALRELELAQPGTSPKDAIRAALLDQANCPGVTAVTVFSNLGDVTDADGIPPHRVEALVDGGEDQDIWDTLLANVADGIGTHGTEEGTATDSEGNEHDVAFSRADEIEIYTSVAVEIDQATFPDDGEDQIQEAIATYGNELGNGYDARVSVPRKPAEGVTGVLAVTEVRLYTDAIETGTAWAPTTAYSATPGARDVVTNNGRSYICITSGTSAGSGGPIAEGTDITDGTAHWRFLGATVPITSRQRATYDTSRITVTTTNGTP